MFGKGISREGDVLDLAANINVINKSGAWYAYEGSKIGQGRENAKVYLREHPEIMKEVDHKVREHYGLIPSEEAAQSEDKTAGKPVKELKSVTGNRTAQVEVKPEAVPDTEKNDASDQQN